MVYGVFYGCYSDWDVIGYFDNRLDADKYCTAYGNGEYHVREIKDLKNKKDLSKISLKYEHEIVFDICKGQFVMRNEPTRYNCYISEELKPNRIQYLGCRHNLVSFFVNIDKDNRKLAEKIAQDYLYQLLAYDDNKKINQKYVELMNEQFLEPYKIREKLKKQEELRKKELSELAKLKEKYENK